MTAGSILLAYHGCDLSTASAVVEKRRTLNPSQNPYDWLGEGIYFWEGSPRRALRWAEYLRNHTTDGKRKILKPAVVGAVIELGNCLDLVDQASLELLREIYPFFKKTIKTTGARMPQNKGAHEGDKDLLLRYLDCAVINFCHRLREEKNLDPFDTVRGVFFEGDSLFEGSRIRARTHIQIAVRNPARVRGYFWPTEFQTSD